MTKTKICTECSTEYPLWQFHYTGYRKVPADVCRQCWSYSKLAYAVRVGGRHARYVYMIGAGNGLCKIGIAKDMDSRLRGIQLMSPVPLTLLIAKITGNGKAIEYYLHSHFAAAREHGEWFRLSHEQILEAMEIICSAELNPSDYRTRPSGKSTGSPTISA